MKAFHDSRDREYRSPYGAIAAGQTVTFALDVSDEPMARVKLRTWVDGVGEALYDMTADSGEGNVTRFTTSLTPQEAGTVWYQFIIEDGSGNAKRYGALEGKRGGTGQLLDWEPPSFQLTVFDSACTEPEPGTSLCEDSDALSTAALRYVRGESTAREFAKALETAHETLPATLFERSLDFIASDGRLRLLAQLGGISENDIPKSWSQDADITEDDEALAEKNALLDIHHLGLAKGRLWCACLMQLLMPELGQIHEANGKSIEDAAARWGCVDADCQTIVVNAADLAHTLPLLVNAPQNDKHSWIALSDDVFGIRRPGTDGSISWLLVNASLQHAHDVAIPLTKDEVSEVISGYGVRIVDALDEDDANDLAQAGQRCAIVHLNQLGTAMVYLHDRELLQKPLADGFGVLAHITSLPANTPDDLGRRKARQAKQGCLGEQAFAFVDWLASAGVRYWQVLPANPTDEYGSPYAGISAFAGNTRLLDGDVLPDDEEWTSIASTDEFQQFCEEQNEWLDPYATFMAIRNRQRSKKAWTSWPKKYRSYDPKIAQGDEKLSSLALKHKLEQFVFEREWKALRAYASDHGVSIIGDMPIYVSSDSADVWAHPELFQLEADGTPGVVAGCPPDAFAEDGQIWGNPVYDWNAASAAGYDWWLRRLQRAFDLYDYVRLDHFIGFLHYFAIPAGELATQGTYQPGPGIDLFQKAYEQFGPLPIIAEDLGSITPAVRALVAECGFPGMDIVQFVDGNDPLSGYAPRPDKIAYTGTHDNQTLVGYCEKRYPHLDAREAAEELARKVAACDAPVCIMPLQDLLGLDDEARMNVPGVAKGNWIWQAKRDDIDDALAYTRELVQLHERGLD